MTTEYDRALNIVPNTYDMHELLHYNAGYIGETRMCVMHRAQPHECAAPPAPPTVYLMKKFDDAPGATLTKRPDDSKRYNECIIQNLHGILKSQELLFKNITKLIQILERDRLDGANFDLQELKQKIADCTLILANQPRLHSLIEQMIEHEIVRCRTRAGAHQTSEEMSLRVSRLQGLAVATLRAKAASYKNNPAYATMDRSRLEAEIERRGARPPRQACQACQTVKKVDPQEIDNYRQLINVIVNEFYKLEDALWRKSSTVKLLEMKSDALNQARCNFINKRRFLKVEADILARVKRSEEIENLENLLLVNDTMFQLFERRLLMQRRNAKSDVVVPLPVKEIRRIWRTVEPRKRAKFVQRKFGINLQNVDDLRIRPEAVRKAIQVPKRIDTRDLFRLTQKQSTEFMDKLFETQKRVVYRAPIERIDREEVRNAAEVLAVNRKAFEENEGVLNIIRLFTESVRPARLALRPQARTKEAELVRRSASNLYIRSESDSETIIASRRFKSEQKLIPLPEREMAKAFCRTLIKNSIEFDSRPEQPAVIRPMQTPSVINAYSKLESSNIKQVGGKLEQVLAKQVIEQTPKVRTIEHSLKVQANEEAPDKVIKQIFVSQAREQTPKVRSREHSFKVPTAEQTPLEKSFEPALRSQATELASKVQSKEQSMKFRTTEPVSPKKIEQVLVNQANEHTSSARNAEPNLKIRTTEHTLPKKTTEQVLVSQTSEHASNVRSTEPNLKIRANEQPLVLKHLDQAFVQKFPDVPIVIKPPPVEVSKKRVETPQKELKPKHEIFKQKIQPESVKVIKKDAIMTPYQKILENIRKKEELNRIKIKNQSSLLIRTTKSQMRKEQAFTSPKPDAKKVLKREFIKREINKGRRSKVMIRSKSQEGSKLAFDHYKASDKRAADSAVSVLSSTQSGDYFSWEEIDEEQFIHDLMDDHLT